MRSDLGFLPYNPKLPVAETTGEVSGAVDLKKEEKGNA
jgi:hypothetical protein